MKTETVAMLLAGGQGSRLGSLTFNNAKPAVLFGGKYRIIDFPLSNAMNSEIDTVGVLTQYRPYILNTYISDGRAWGLDKPGYGVSILPPYEGRKGGRWYAGTADAIAQNIDFIDRYDPEYVLILSGDHIYQMDYSELIDYHKQKQAQLTIAVMEVPWDEAGRFGLVEVNSDNRIIGFQEKPENPKSNLASMGIYVFDWKLLRQELIDDMEDEESKHDFGMNIIPTMHAKDMRIFAYQFSGYWRDVGTIQSYFDANMDLLDDSIDFNINDKNKPFFSNNFSRSPQFIGPDAKVVDSLICDGCVVFGSVDHSILSQDIFVDKNVTLKNCIVHTGAVIGDGAVLENCIVGSYANVPADARYVAAESDNPDEIHVLNS